MKCAVRPPIRSMAAIPDDATHRTIHDSARIPLIRQRTGYAPKPYIGRLRLQRFTHRTWRTVPNNLRTHAIEPEYRDVFANGQLTSHRSNTLPHRRTSVTSQRATLARSLKSPSILSSSSGPPGVVTVSWVWPPGSVQAHFILYCTWTSPFMIPRS